MNDVRAANNEDARRLLAVEMFKHHVSHVLGSTVARDYQADIEYMEHALLAFADEWATRDLAVPEKTETSRDADKKRFIDLILGEDAVLWQNTPDDPCTFEVRRDGKHAGFVRVTDGGEDDEPQIVWI